MTDGVEGKGPGRLGLRRIVRSTIFVLGGSFLGLVLLILLAESRFIYFPQPFVAGTGNWDLPLRSGGRVEDVTLSASDGVKIHGWYGRGKNASFTLLYLHGNGGSLSGRAFWVMKLLELPVNVLAIDYRGYGRSEGSPSEEGLYRDAMAAWKHLVETRACPAHRIVLYGKSLGGGPATWLAERVKPAALILQSTFTSATDMGNRTFPLGPFMRTKFPNVERLARIHLPTLIIHSRGDELIPFSMGEALLAASAGQAKRLRAYETEGHNELVPNRADDLLKDFRSFLARL